MTWTVRPGVLLKREQLETRIEELERQRDALLDECDQAGWISTCHVRELLGEPCLESTETPVSTSENSPPVPESNKGTP